MVPQTSRAAPQNAFLIHSEALHHLTEKMDEFSRHLCTLPVNSKQEIMQLISGIALLMNVASKLADIHLVDETNIQDFLKTRQLFESLFTAFANMNNKHDLLIISGYLEDLLTLKLNSKVAVFLRDEISVNFLKIFFDLLNYEDVVDSGMFSKYF